MIVSTLFYQVFNQVMDAGSRFFSKDIILRQFFQFEGNTPPPFQIPHQSDLPLAFLIFFKHIVIRIPLNLEAVGYIHLEMVPFFDDLCNSKDMT